MAKTTATESEHLGHVRAWAKRGLSARAYGARTGVNPNTLMGWRWQMRRQEQVRGSSEAPVLAFIELAGAAGGGAAEARIELRLEGMTGRVVDGFEAETLRRVLTVVGACS